MNSKTLKVHPAAECFPMLGEADLAVIVADMEANGFDPEFPIITSKLNGEEELVDGRNRLKAAQLAGVEPLTKLRKFKDNDDILAFIARANLGRRDLKKAQKAMAYAMMYPKPEKGGRGKKARQYSVETTEFSTGLLSHARTILGESPALAEDVLYDREALEVVYKKVLETKQQSKSHDARIARLEKDAPDLAAQVSDKRLTFAEANAALEERQRQLEMIRDGGRKAASRIGEFVSHVVCIEHAASIGERGLTNGERIAEIEAALNRLKALHSKEEA